MQEIEYIKENYDVSRNGVVTRKSDGRVFNGVKDQKGYLRVRLKLPLLSKNKDGRKPYKIHRLVAMFYLDNYSDKLQVNHKNGIKTDNRVENLEMVTNRENVIHAWRKLDSTERKRKLNSFRDIKTGKFTKKND